MTIYTVLAPETRDREPAVGQTAQVFVKEGFSWPALLFAGPWLIYRRMWLVLTGYVAVAVAVSLIGRQVGGSLPGLFVLLVHFLFALEANELRRWTLKRRGYGLVGVAEGRGVEEAEIRFFSALEEAAPAAPTPPTPPTPVRQGPVPPSAEAGDVVGLFPAPGGASS